MNITVYKLIDQISKYADELDAMKRERDEALLICERLNVLVENYQKTQNEIAFRLADLKREMKEKGYVFPGVGEWIDHDGEGYPDVNGDALVHVKFRGGEFSDFGDPCTVMMWGGNWLHREKPCAGDIVAYKIVGGENEQG